jgi:hypothetical protein
MVTLSSNTAVPCWNESVTSLQVDYVNVSFCRSAEDLHVTRQHLDTCACLLTVVDIYCPVSSPA